MDWFSRDFPRKTTISHWSRSWIAGQQGEPQRLPAGRVSWWNRCGSYIRRNMGCIWIICRLLYMQYMEYSINRDTPKWIFFGKSYQDDLEASPISGNLHIFFGWHGTMFSERKQLHWVWNCWGHPSVEVIPSGSWNPCGILSCAEGRKGRGHDWTDSFNYP